MTSDTTISVLRDVLRVYDHRYLDLDRAQRERLFEGTRQVIGEEGLSDAARAALPASVRLRAFCIQHGLDAELERLIRDEAEGGQAGAVVVGGRVYALYPYLRGVPRKDADITTEVGVDHRLEAAGWQGRRLRVRGTAALQRVDTHRTSVDVVLRERTSGQEHCFPAEPRDQGPQVHGAFELVADLAAVEPGRWDVHVAATALGVRREARFGSRRPARLRTTPQRRTIGSPGRAAPGDDAPEHDVEGGDPGDIRDSRGTGDAGETAGKGGDAREATLYFTKGGHLALLVTAGPRPASGRSLLARIRRRLTGR